MNTLDGGCYTSVEEYNDLCKVTTHNSPHKLYYVTPKASIICIILLDHKALQHFYFHCLCQASDKLRVILKLKILIDCQIQLNVHAGAQHQ